MNLIAVNEWVYSPISFITSWKPGFFVYHFVNIVESEETRKLVAVSSPVVDT